MLSFSSLEDNPIENKYAIFPKNLRIAILSHAKFLPRNFIVSKSDGVVYIRKNVCIS